MQPVMTAEDVLALAEQVESDAGDFYSRAAEATDNLRARQLLQRLAALENDHERVFSGMRHHAEQHPELFEDENAANDEDILTQHFASGVREHLEQLFRPDMSAKQVLQKAIEFEKDTILFFTGLRHLLKDPRDQFRLDLVIREELGHVLQLTSELATGLEARCRTHGES